MIFIALVILSLSLVDANLYIINVSAQGFNPSSLTISPGDSVKFVTTDNSNHQVVCDDGTAPFTFKSDLLNYANSYFLVTPVPTIGTFRFYDAQYPSNVGSFTVTASNPQVVTIAVGPGCTFPASTQIYAGDVLAIQNTAGSPVYIAIYSDYPSMSHVVLAGQINAGATYSIDTGAQSQYVTAGGSYSLTCTSPSSSSPSLLSVGYSRTAAPVASSTYPVVITSPTSYLTYKTNTFAAPDCFTQCAQACTTSVASCTCNPFKVTCRVAGSAATLVVPLALIAALQLLLMV